MTAEQEKLVVENMKLVPYVRKKYFNSISRIIGEEDLDEEGYIALVRAARDFDPTLGIKFSTVSAKYIRNEMLLYIDRRWNRVHVPNNEWVKMTIEQKKRISVLSVDALDAKDTSTLMTLRDMTIDVETHAVLLADITAALKETKPSKRGIIISLLKGNTMAEIARDMGVTHQWISKIVSDFRKQMKYKTGGKN